MCREDPGPTTGIPEAMRRRGGEQRDSGAASGHLPAARSKGGGRAGAHARSDPAPGQARRGPVVFSRVSAHPELGVGKGP